MSAATTIVETTPDALALATRELEPVAMNPRIVDLTGRRFGRWIVLGLTGGNTTLVNGHYVAIWSVRCDCGALGSVQRTSLMRGRSRSCGCLRLEMSSARKLTHGHTAGHVRTTEYVIWSGIHQRCGDPRSAAYESYGGRGITVCARWHDFASFLADVGPRPPGLSLDRFPNKDGNYEPGNVRWATPREQMNNTRSNVLIEWNGETHSVMEWSRRLGIRFQRIYSRLRGGWSGAQALGFEPRGSKKGGLR
jgi:hypothetical protein